MRVLFVGKEADGMGVACRLAAQNNDVYFYAAEPRFARAGKGIVNRVSHWREVVAKCDLVICDMVGFGVYEERFKAMGKPTLACNAILDQAELDRAKCMQLFRACEIKIPETYDCMSGDQAREVVKQLNWEAGWVIKPCGNQATCKTMVVKDKAIFDWALGEVSGQMIIQRIVDGVEVSTEGWFNGRDFIRPFNHTFEEKKFLNDDLGPATGCMGNVVFAAPSDKLTQATVERLAPFLSRVGYRGPVDINCIVNKEGAYALEISSRMGYDAIEALMEGLDEPPIDLFFECATGTKKSMRLTQMTMMAVRLSIPPWPMAKPGGEDYGSPVLGLSPGALDHVYLCDVYKEKDEYFAAGGDGVLLKATARGRADGNDLVGEARNRVYRTLNNVKVSGKMYRTDIGKRVNKDVAQLKEWGWL